MKNTFLAILFALISLTLFTSSAVLDERVIAAGSQPQVSVDNNGIIRVVFGREDKIFCASSLDKGVTFSNPVLVASVPEMHLGMSRGPQLASSAHYSIITAMDKAGNIHWFRLNHLSNKWKSMGIINDIKGSAPEGLMNIATDKKNDRFYAVWLDTRIGKHNQIYFSHLLEKTNQWSKNQLAYKSPDEHVCECCQPHISVHDSVVAIMFRNWLNGSRDMYVLRSSNSGKSFSPAEKLGLDTWKLNGCPMDGGGIVFDQAASIQTTWQRKGLVYYCQPGQPEVFIGKGRTSSISGAGANTYISYQNSDTLKLVALKNKRSFQIGNGAFLKFAALPESKVLCVWEKNKNIVYKKISSDLL
jgi:hypothetical protein